MDHQAFSLLLGSYGEFVGAVAVVATLIYLALQVRQNTRALRFNTVMQLPKNYRPCSVGSLQIRG